VVDLGVSGGEPFMRPDLFEILEHACGLGMAVGVASNGTTLTPERAARLARMGVDRYQVSLDGPPASHDELRQWPGLFERVRRTIRLARERGLRTHVCCTINRLNWQQLDPFAALVAESGVQRLNFSRYVPTGRGVHALDLPAGAWHRVIRQCVRLRDEYRGRMEVTTHLAQQVLVDCEVAGMRGHIGCQAGVGQGCVTANGTVWPCVLLPVPLGNVRTTRFADVWSSSPVVRELRDRDALKGRCAACAWRSRCGGCRAVAYARTGDYLYEDERCWLYAAPAERERACGPNECQPEGDQHGKATVGRGKRTDRPRLLRLYP
jgi:radical SAM protein with 4Fe4S-binding SPASM domain